ncbi:MAG: DUF6151 family protein [Pseudomonadota bacterium]
MSAEIEHSCACGDFSASLLDVSPRTVTRGVCYCKDCQAFAHYLGRADDILDAAGGTTIHQTAPSRIKITRGADRVAAMRLSARGLIRWFADCCHSPIGNTPPARWFAFVGLIERKGQFDAAENDALGPPRFAVFTEHAERAPDPQLKTPNPYLNLGPILAQVARERLAGRHRQTPFFQEDGSFAAKPIVLSDAERDSLMSKIGSECQ